jgi:hypothetical protein
MNMYHVQRDPLWASASKECRSEFIEAMRGKDYDAASTKEAWGWFSLGWAACILFRNKAKPCTHENCHVVEGNSSGPYRWSCGRIEG